SQLAANFMPLRPRTSSVAVARSLGTAQTHESRARCASWTVGSCTRTGHEAHRHTTSAVLAIGARQTPPWLTTTQAIDRSSRNREIVAWPHRTCAPRRRHVEFGQLAVPKSRRRAHLQRTQLTLKRAEALPVLVNPRPRS